jgi:hypothetical protein
MRTLAELLGLSPPLGNPAPPPPFANWALSSGAGAPYLPPPWTPDLNDLSAPASRRAPDFATGGILGPHLAAHAAEANGLGGILGPVAGMFGSPPGPTTTPESDALAVSFGKWPSEFGSANSTDTPFGLNQNVNLPWVPQEFSSPQVRETTEPPTPRTIMRGTEDSPQNYTSSGFSEPPPLGNNGTGTSLSPEYPWLQPDATIEKRAGYRDFGGFHGSNDAPDRFASGLIDPALATFDRGSNDNAALMRTLYDGMTPTASVNNSANAILSAAQNASQLQTTGLPTDLAPTQRAQFFPLDLVNYHETPFGTLNAAAGQDQNDFRPHVRLDFPGTVNSPGQKAQYGRFEQSYERETYLPPGQIQLAQYVHPSAITGVPKIDSTSQLLADTLKDTADALGRVAPRGIPANLFGIQVHVDFARRIKALDLPGIGIKGVEQSFSLGGLKDYGIAGTIRTDVYLKDRSGRPIAIYDVKTGNAKLSPARVEELREAVGVPNIPVFELRLDDLTAWPR